jgi:hypothetical protein
LSNGRQKAEFLHKSLATAGLFRAVRMFDAFNWLVVEASNEVPKAEFLAEADSILTASM